LKPTISSFVFLLSYLTKFLFNSLSFPKVNYGGAGTGGSRGKIWTEDEDAYLVCMMHRHGYGQWERIRQEIRRAWQFKFDWFFKSRNAAELQRRGDVLLR